MDYVAIDIGSGLTKFMMGETRGFFPSSVGEDKESGGFNLGINDNENIKYKGKIYLTGDSAMKTLKATDLTTSTSKSWCKNDAQLTLTFSVIAKLYPNGFEGSLGLGLGLPIGLYKQEHVEYKKKFVGTHEFETATSKYKVKFIESDIEVLPQVLGLHFKNLFRADSNENEIKNQKVGYIDPGTQTMGFAVIDNQIFSRNLSDGVDIGMTNLADKLKDLLLNRYGYEANSKLDILRALRLGSLTIYSAGKPETINMIEQTPTLVEKVYGKTLDDISILWKKGLDMPVLVSSGGGDYILEEVKKRFPHAELLNQQKKNKPKKGESADVDVNQAIYDVVEGIFYYYMTKQAKKAA